MHCGKTLIPPLPRVMPQHNPRTGILWERDLYWSVLSYEAIRSETDRDHSREKS